MGLYLFDFVYNTLMTKANTSGNALFLPTALSSMKDGSGQPYLPLHGNDWSLDKIKEAPDISNDMASSWWNAIYIPIYVLSKETPNPPTITQQMIDDAMAALDYCNYYDLNVIAYPNVGPDLTANNVEIQGLANIKVSGAAPQVTQSNEGYTAQITLTANAYSTNDAWSQTLALGGTQAGTDSNSSQSFFGLNFSLTQCLCFVGADNITPVASPPTLNLPASSSGSQYGFDAKADGIALLTLSNAELVAKTQITVSSDGQTLQVNLESLALQGEQDESPTFSLQNLQFLSLTPLPFSTIDPSNLYPAWTTFFQNLLATEDAAALLTSQINKVLNASNNLAQVETLLNQQLANAFNTIFRSSQVADSKVDTDANAVDKYLFNRARAALNDQASYVYVPTLVLGSQSPTLEPYTADNLSIDGPFSTSVLNVQISISKILLSSLSITGLSNLVAPANNIIFGDNQQANAALLLGTLNPGPTLNVNGQQRTVPSPPLQASSPFSLNVQVDANNPITIAGTLTLNLQNKSGTLGVDTTLTASGDTQDQLQLTYTNITLVAADNDMTASVTLDDDPNGLGVFVNAVINQPQVIEAILSALNGYISQNLGQISQAATNFAQSALNNIGQ